MTDTYVEFRPVIRGKDALVYTEISSFPASFPDRFCKVLKYYRQDYKLDTDSTILITQTLMEDKELLWNYTNKANDEQWLRTHLP